MGTIEEVKVTGRKYRVWDGINSIWKRISYWTHASDVEFEDGKNAEEKIVEINDTIDNMSETFSEQIQTMDSDKVTKMTGVSGYQTVDVLGYNPITSELGLKVNGADTVIPFSTKHTLTYPVTSNGLKDLGVKHKYRYLNVNVPAGSSLVAVSTITGRDGGGFGIGYGSAVVGKFYLALGTTYGGTIGASGATTLLPGVYGTGTKEGVWAGIATSTSIWLSGFYGANFSGWAYIYELR